jgi:iduronate 2-sulfatase
MNVFIKPKTLVSLIPWIVVLSADLLLAGAAERPNVIFIVCDDLNDYVEGFGGHPQAHTPNMARLSRSGVSFTQAHCNAPICGPSRASLFTGIYPHNSGCYGFERWDRYEVLKNSRTIMDHFRANGYHTLGTGKLMHHLSRKDWIEYGHAADYGPFAFDGTERVAHPDVPAPFRAIGTVDGSFGPLVRLTHRRFADGKSYSWQTGGWRQTRALRVDSQQDRDWTADELNGKWACEKLAQLAKRPSGKPFFMGVGFIRPHTPLIVPERFFKRFPLSSIKLPVIKPNDVEDTHARSVRGDPGKKEPSSSRTADMGLRLFSDLVASFDSQDEAIRRFLQAYLASVASVDELIGNILDVVDNSGLADNTIIVVASDHGWGMGEKDYLYKNSLWQESTRVPLIIRAPGTAKVGGVVERPVSLIDLYPTLIDLCGLTGDTRKNDKGRSLDGYSLKPLLENPSSKEWSGPGEVLTALYRWSKLYDPGDESYSLRSNDWRYIRYRNGKEELYHTAKDPYEWDNLAGSPEQVTRIKNCRERLRARLPAPGVVPEQPQWKPASKVGAKPDAEAWKDAYFAKHPDADADKDGELTWPELKAYRAKIGDDR